MAAMKAWAVRDLATGLFLEGPYWRGWKERGKIWNSHSAAAAACTRRKKIGQKNIEVVEFDLVEVKNR